MKPSPENTKICVVGLGYVGLPLAVKFAEKFQTTGFDIQERRIDELKSGYDCNGEVTSEELAAARNSLVLTNSLDDFANCNVYIVTVPTPIDGSNKPDLDPLRQASAAIGRSLSAGDIVIYESTVYPGVTEGVCGPILEEESGLTLNEDFFIGYSPERMNPGDKEHPFDKIVKVTSGSTPEAAEFVDTLYATVVRAGTYRAPSIMVAEAAKVIENTQRDLNIALVSELALIFKRLGIDTGEVIDAASTKWNFMPMRPGLVGGHCIGVDPYYLIHKSQMAGYHPDVIMAGRRINDGMALYVAGEVLALLRERGKQIDKSRVLVFGLTFKENCPDTRNSKVIDMVNELRRQGASVDLHDSWADPRHVKECLGIDLIDEPESDAYDAVILAVAHKQYREKNADWFRSFGKPDAVLYDIKSVLDKNAVDGRL